MSARLIADLYEEANTCDRRAAMYRLAGTGSMARMFDATAQALRSAASSLDAAHAAEGEAINQSKEC